MPIGARLEMRSSRENPELARQEYKLNGKLVTDVLPQAGGILRHGDDCGFLEKLCST